MDKSKKGKGGKTPAKSPTQTQASSRTQAKAKSRIQTQTPSRTQAQGQSRQQCDAQEEEDRCRKAELHYRRCVHAQHLEGHLKGCDESEAHFQKCTHAFDHHLKCERTSSLNVVDVTSEDNYTELVHHDLTPHGSMCGLAEYEDKESHIHPRGKYCRWIRGEIPVPPPKVEKPDHKKTLRELGSKYMHKFGDVKCVMIDLSGTLHVGNNIMEGAVEALAALRTLEPLVGLKIRFVTNTTKESKRRLLERIRGLGFTVKDQELYTSLSAARAYVDKLRLRPLLILDERAKEDFEGVPQHCLNSVLVGLSIPDFNYLKMSEALRLLMKGGHLVGVHKGRCYESESGMALGPGPFISMLEYATDVPATILGKPELEFFKTVISSTGYEFSQAVMIGDDVYDDVGGSMKLGMKGILVQTGKYRELDEGKIFPMTPDFLAKNFAVAVRCIIGSILVKRHLPTGESGDDELYTQGNPRVIHGNEAMSGPAFLEKMMAYVNMCSFAHGGSCEDPLPVLEYLDELLDLSVFYNDEAYPVTPPEREEEEEEEQQEEPEVKRENFGLLW